MSNETYLKDLEEFVEGSGNSGFFVFTVGSVIQMVSKLMTKLM